MQRFGIQSGLILLSLIFHALMIGGGVAVNQALIFFGFGSTNEERTETELIIVPIDVVELGEINNIAPVITPPEAEPEDEDLIEPEEEELPPEEDEVIPEDPVDETLPEDEIEQVNPDSAPPETLEDDIVPDLDVKPEAEEEAPEPEPEPKPEPRKAPPVQRPEDDLDSLFSELESTFASERETRKRTPKPRAERKPESLLEDTPPKPQTPRRGAGERTANTARLENLFYNQVEPCTVSIRDQPNWRSLNVRLEVRLRQDGRLDGDPKLIEPSRRPIGRSPMGIALQRALTAIRKCQPYRLPEDDFETWREIKLNIGPEYGLDK
ncbi:MAG: cell envelope integrity protein TolA [Pseudomonadota bacterium]